jgi:hypothetical protein
MWGVKDGFVWFPTKGMDGNKNNPRINATGYKVDEMAYLMDNLAGPKSRCRWSCLDLAGRVQAALQV